MSKDLKLMVKRVFITSDFGEYGLPQWASWVKAVIDGKLSLLPSAPIRINNSSYS